MSDALPRRIEATDLKPGDVFEYVLQSSYAREAGKVKRDTVKSTRDGSYSLHITERRNKADGTSSEVTGLRLFTEVGQTNHHWVLLSPADTVVVLIEQEKL